MSPDRYTLFGAERRYRFRIVLGVVSAITSFILYIAKSYMSYAMELPLILISLGLLSISAIIFIMVYLQTGFKRLTFEKEEYTLNSDIDSNILRHLGRLDKEVGFIGNMLEKKIEAINARLELDEGVRQAISDEDRTSLIDTIRTRLLTESVDDFLSAIEVRVEEHTKSEDWRMRIWRQTNDSIQRLLKEISDLGRRGNLNLAIGILTTSAGLAILGYYVLSLQLPVQEPWVFTVYFFPRLTLVVFIEVFAYFFLRLYKSSLTEIKYFQNEITNLESKFIALSIALKSDNQPTYDSIILEFSRTERNHILNKGQTTVDLERSRNEKDLLSDFVAKVLALIGRVTD